VSPHERRQFAINFTWSWPAVLTLLFLAMLPIWGPLLPPIEGAVWPVTSKVSFVEQSSTQDGITTRMSYVKNRDCEIIGVSMDRLGVPVEFQPVSGSLDKLSTRGTGPQISRQWFIGDTNLEGLRLRFLHRCSPLWITVTLAYP